MANVSQAEIIAKKIYEDCVHLTEDDDGNIEYITFDVPDATKIIQDAIDAAAPKWLPIETAPKDMKPILVYDPRNVEGERVRIVVADGGFWEWMRKDGGKTFSHWMPLPAAPVDDVK